MTVILPDAAEGFAVDLAVAEEVFGFRYVTFDRIKINGRWENVPTRLRVYRADDPPVADNPPAGTYAGMDQVRPYTSDIRAAWSVVEHMNAQGWGWDADQRRSEGERFAYHWRFRKGAMVRWAAEPTAPLAICRAALKVSRSSSRNDDSDAS